MHGHAASETLARDYDVTGDAGKAGIPPEKSDRPMRPISPVEFQLKVTWGLAARHP